jgi:hypothetical protein
MTEAPNPMAADVVIDGATYTVLKLGTPVAAKSATASHLRSLGFTAMDLTLLGLANASGGYDFHYIAWCTLTTTQKLVTPALFEALMAHAREAGSLPEPPPPGNRETVTLLDGTRVSVPVVPEFVPPSKKRKATAPKPLDALAAGAFVLSDALLAGGKVHPDLKRVAFPPRAGTPSRANAHSPAAPPVAPAAATPGAPIVTAPVAVVTATAAPVAAAPVAVVTATAAPVAAAPSAATHPAAPPALVSFAQMLLHMQASPAIEQLHAWARSALRDI